MLNTDAILYLACKYIATDSALNGSCKLDFGCLASLKIKSLFQMPECGFNFLTVDILVAFLNMLKSNFQNTF